MRIAHFVQRYPPALGGSEAFFARLSRHLAVQGDDVQVFTTNALDLEAFWTTRGRVLRPGRSTEDGVTVRRYRLLRLPYQRHGLRALSLLPWRRWQLLTRSCNPVAPEMWLDAGRPEARFDLVHATAFPYGWPLACAHRLARRLGVPFLLTPFLHLGDPDDPGDRTRRAYTHPCLMSLIHAADRVFVQTGVEHDYLRQTGLPESKLVLLGMGVDLPDCAGGDRAAARRAWGVADDEVVVGHLANLSFEKGAVDLLRAAALAWRGGSRFRVVLAGPEMPNFRSFWANFRETPQVLRLGVLSAAQKRDFFAAIDTFALPSRSDSFGIVLAEAMANGVATLGYRAGGVPGVIRDGIDGLVVKCGDLHGLADALVGLERNTDKRHRLGAAGRQRVVAGEFDWPTKLDRVRSAYVDLRSSP